MNKSLFILGVFLASAFATDFYTYTYYAETSCSGNTAFGFQPVDECNSYSKTTCDNTGVKNTIYSDETCSTSVESVSYKLDTCTDYNFKVSGCGLSFDDSINSVAGIWVVTYENADCSGKIVNGFGLEEGACWNMGESAYFKLTVDGDSVTQHNCTDSACKSCSNGETQTIGSCVEDGIKLYYSDAMSLSVSMLVVFLAAILLLH